MERSERDDTPNIKVVRFNLKNTLVHIVPTKDSSRDGSVWIFESMKRRAKKKKIPVQKNKTITTIPGQNGLFLV